MSRGRGGGTATTKTQKLREQFNRPPPKEPWIWLTREILESPSWRALTIGARRVLERVALEHMAHAGTQNGELIVTFDDFERHGIRRGSISESIAVAVRLGFLDVITRGRRSWGGSRLPSKYGLTWLPRGDLTPASNRWKCRATDSEAERLLLRRALSAS